MTISQSRRSFLRGRPSLSAPAAPRPPWAVSTDTFFRQCTRCLDCVGACAENIIVAGDGGFPEVDFAKGECTFCGACAQACTDNALVLHDGAPWAMAVSVGDGCLSAQGVTCRVCGDNCDSGAIRFQLGLRGAATITLSQDACTGCGACVAPCPVDAITLAPIPTISQPTRQTA